MIDRLSAPDADRAKALSAVHHAAFTPDGRGWSAAEITSLAASGRLYADARNRAFALFSLVLDEAELLTIAVSPEHQRQGLATALLDHAAAALRSDGARVIHLEVAADNAAAIHLYQTLGYQPTGRRKGYYRRRQGTAVDALLMALTL